MVQMMSHDAGEHGDIGPWRHVFSVVGVWSSSHVWSSSRRNPHFSEYIWFDGECHAVPSISTQWPTIFTELLRARQRSCISRVICANHGNASWICLDRCTQAPSIGAILDSWLASCIPSVSPWFGASGSASPEAGCPWPAAPGMKLGGLSIAPCVAAAGRPVESVAEREQRAARSPQPAQAAWQGSGWRGNWGHNGINYILLHHDSSPIQWHKEQGCGMAVGSLFQQILQHDRWNPLNIPEPEPICRIICMAESQSFRQKPVANECKAYVAWS